MSFHFNQISHIPHISSRTQHYELQHHNHHRTMNHLLLDMHLGCMYSSYSNCTANTLILWAVNVFIPFEYAILSVNGLNNSNSPYFLTQLILIFFVYPKATLPLLQEQSKKQIHKNPLFIIFLFSFTLNNHNSCLLSLRN